MTPEQIAKSESEAAHQSALFAWVALNLSNWPDLWGLHHIPNGGARGDSPKSRMIQGAKLKAQGTKPGVADLFLPVARGSWHGLYIEMKEPGKRPKKSTSKGGLSDEQIEFRDFVLNRGYGYAVCYTWVEAKDVLINYLMWG